MNDGEVVLNPCICYAEVIHSSSRIRFKWHRCETQNKNTGKLGATHNEPSFFWLFVMMAAMVQMRVMSARHCRFTWKVLIRKDFMSDTLIRLQSQLILVMHSFWFFAGSSTNNSFLQTFFVVEFVHLYTFECNPAVQQ
jgi:hypothetical protein